MFFCSTDWYERFLHWSGHHSHKDLGIRTHIFISHIGIPWYNGNICSQNLLISREPGLIPGLTPVQPVSFRGIHGNLFPGIGVLPPHQSKLDDFLHISCQIGHFQEIWLSTYLFTPFSPYWPFSGYLTFVYPFLCKSSILIMPSHWYRLLFVTHKLMQITLLWCR